MATITTVDGIQITFSPKTISVITDHDAVTGEAVTCVYGITVAALRTKEPAPTLMKRLRIAANFAQLTRPNGSPVWIDGASVSSLRAPLPDEFVDGVNTVVFASALTQGVKESPSVATAALNAQGADL